MTVRARRQNPDQTPTHHTIVSGARASQAIQRASKSGSRLDSRGIDPQSAKALVRALAGMAEVSEKQRRQYTPVYSLGHLRTQTRTHKSLPAPITRPL